MRTMPERFLNDAGMMPDARRDARAMPDVHALPTKVLMDGELETGTGYEQARHRKRVQSGGDSAPEDAQSSNGGDAGEAAPILKRPAAQPPSAALMKRPATAMAGEAKVCEAKDVVEKIHQEVGLMRENRSEVACALGRT